MTEGKILHGAHEQVHVLRYVGDVRYPLAPSVAKFVDSLMSDKDLVGLVIDLTEASMIDSTNLGQLARVATAMQARCGKQTTLVSNQEDINTLLKSMGMDSLFNMIETAPSEAHLAPIGISQPTEAELGSIMLVAHRTLMELNDENRAEFENVVDLLEKQTVAPAMDTSGASPLTANYSSRHE